MENCLYNGKRICSFDVYNEFGVKVYSVSEEWHEAAKKNELTCEECGWPVVFKPGDIRQPHFAHKPGERILCSLNSQESEERVKAKKILYLYFRRTYPQANTETNYRHRGGYKSDVFVIFPGGKRLAVEFLRDRMGEASYNGQNAFYKARQIPVVWFLSKAIFAQDTSKGFLVEGFLNKGNFKAIFLDVESEQVTFKRYMNYFDENGTIKNQREFSKAYPLDVITIKPDGQIVSPFDWDYADSLERFLAKNREFERQKPRKLAPSPSLFLDSRDVTRTIPTLASVSSPKSSITPHGPDLSNSSIAALESLLSICKESEVLGKWGHVPPYSTYLQTITACERIFRTYHSTGVISSDDIARLRIRISSLLRNLKI